MDAWKICFVVLAAVCISCEGTSSRKKDLPAGGECVARERVHDGKWGLIEVLGSTWD